LHLGSAPIATATHAPPLEAPARPQFDIVPRRGLPVVAAVVVFLIVAIAGNWLWALDFFHVVGGGAWTALDLFIGFVVGPMIGRMSIPARIEITTRLMPKLLLIMPTLVTMTLGSGFQLARHLGYLDPSYPRHAWIVASFIVVAAMALVALVVIEPTNVAVLFELKREQPRPELIGRLMQRFIYTSAITGVLQVGTLIIMTRIAS
jgi:hypothetical protein